MSLGEFLTSSGCVMLILFPKIKNRWNPHGVQAKPGYIVQRFRPLPWPWVFFKQGNEWNYMNFGLYRCDFFFAQIGEHSWPKGCTQHQKESGSYRLNPLFPLLFTEWKIEARAPIKRPGS